MSHQDKSSQKRISVNHFALSGCRRQYFKIIKQRQNSKFIFVKNTRVLPHSTRCCPLLWKLCKALFWCKTIRKGIELGVVKFLVPFFQKSALFGQYWKLSDISRLSPGNYQQFAKSSKSHISLLVIFSFVCT